MSVFMFRLDRTVHPITSECKREATSCPIYFSVLVASPDHRKGQFYVSGESQCPKLQLFRSIPPRPFLPQPPSSPKSAPVCGSPTPLILVGDHAQTQPHLETTSGAVNPGCSHSARLTAHPETIHFDLTA